MAAVAFAGVLFAEAPSPPLPPPPARAASCTASKPFSAPSQVTPKADCSTRMSMARLEWTSSTTSARRRRERSVDVGVASPWAYRPAEPPIAAALAVAAAAVAAAAPDRPPRFKESDGLPPEAPEPGPCTSTGARTGASSTPPRRAVVACVSAPPVSTVAAATADLSGDLADAAAAEPISSEPTGGVSSATGSAATTALGDASPPHTDVGSDTALPTTAS